MNWWMRNFLFVCLSIIFLPLQVYGVCSDVMTVSSYSDLIDAINCNANIIQIEKNVTIIGTIYVNSLNNIKFLGNGHYFLSDEIQTFQFNNCTSIEILNLRFHSRVQNDPLISFNKSSILLSDVVGDQNRAPLLWIESSNIKITKSQFTNTQSNLYGALYCSDSSINLEETIFSHNIASKGAAIESIDCSIDIWRSTFENNTVSGSGGAISAISSIISIHQSNIHNNDATVGGGAFLFSSCVVNITSSVFDGNRCGQKSLPSSNSVGGAISDVGSNIYFTNIQFSENIAYGNGGALSLASQKVILINCDFTQNRALDGGAMILSLGNYNFQNCIVNSNKATILATSGNGGGIYLSTHAVLIADHLECKNNQAIVSGGCFYLNTNYSLSCSDCTIVKNKGGTGVGSGGAISAIGRTPYRPTVHLYGKFCNISSNSGASGGGIASTLTFLTIQDCLLSDNTGTTGGGLYLQSMYSVNLQSIIVMDNIATGQGGGILATASTIYLTSSQINTNQVAGPQLGGGIYLGSQSTLYLQTVTFKGNSAGSASALFATESSRIYMEDSTVMYNTARQASTFYIRSYSLFSVTNSTFHDNAGGATAGVTYCTSYSICSYELSTFTSNLALTYGGVIVVDLWATVSITNSLLTNNEGREAGGTFYATTYGKLFVENVTVSDSLSIGKGGVAFLSTFGSMDISNSILNSNAAAIGGAIHAEFNANLYLQNITMNNNVASYLGGVISALDSVDIIGSMLQFHNNHALYGGCFYLLIECYVDLDEIYSRNNTAELQGGFVRAAGLVVMTISNALLEDHGAEYGGVVDISSAGVKFFLKDSTIQNNYAHQYGGFVSIADGAFLDLRNCNILQNNAIFGGGVYVANGFAAIHESTFKSNYAIDSGGAVKIYSGNVSVDNSYFSFNSAKDSGGVFHCERTSVLTLDSSTFSNNTAGENGGVIYGSDDIQFTSSYNIFTQNMAFLFGGLLYSEKGGIFSFISTNSSNNTAMSGGGSVFIRSNFNITIRDCTFVGDAAYDISYGGAIHFQEPLDVWMTRNIFRDCRGGNGGAIQIQGYNPLQSTGEIEISYSMFENNQFIAGMNSSARYARCMDQTAGNGGAVYFSSTLPNARISRSTFIRNSGCNGGAFFLEGGTSFIENTKFIENIAFIGGGAMFWKMPSTSPLITTSSVTGTNNKAKYGSLIATDKSTLSITHDSKLESSGHVFTSPVIVYVQDFYKQTVTSDLSSFVVINSRDASVVSGSTIIRALNGIAKFDEITITSTIGGKASMLFIISAATPIIAIKTFYFRNCTLGEIPQDAGIGLFNGNEVQLTQCYYCPIGSYALKPTSTHCLDCPDNANCNGGNNIEVKKGYWRVSNFSDEILKCKGTSVAACKGGSNGPYTCTKGNTGPYCTLCKSHYIATIDGTCQYCSGQSTSSLGFIIAMIIFGIILIFLLLGWFYRRKLINCFESTYNSIVETLESQSSKIKILFAFTQIMSQFPAVLAMPRIPFFSAVNSYLGVLSFDLFSYFEVQCELTYTFYDKLVLVTMIPICIAPVIYIYYYLKALLSTLRNSTNPDFSYWDAKRQSTYYFLVLLFVIFAPSSTIVLQAFVCEKFDDGTSYMYADYNLSCDTDVHRQYIIYASVMVILYPLGIPIFYLYLLWSNLHAINPPTKRVVKDAERHIVSPEIIQLEKLKLRDNDDDITHLAFLFESYRPGAWYFEVIECLRRLFLTAIPSLILPGTAVQTIIVLIFSMVFSFLYAELKPFVVHSDSIAAIGAEWGLTLTLLMGLIVTVSDYEESLASTAKNFIGLVMIGVNLGTMVFTVYVSVFNEDDKQKKALDKFNNSRSRKRASSTSSRFRKRGTNETLLTKVRLSFKRSLRRSGFLDAAMPSDISAVTVENPAIVELTGIKRGGGGGVGGGGEEGEGERFRSSSGGVGTTSPVRRRKNSRFKSKARDSDDESDSDDSAAGERNEAQQGVIRKNPHDSLKI